MRRMLGLSLAALLVLAVSAPASAQVVAPIPAFGTMVYSGASITAVNTTAEVSAFQYTIPAAFTASATTVGALSSQYFTGSTSTGNNTPVLWGVPQPMHLRMLGRISSTAGAGGNLGINLGGTVATISFNPTFVTGTTLAPHKLDVWLAPLASSTATPNSPNSFTMMLYARWEVPGSGPGATPTVLNSTTIANVNLASPNQLNVIMRESAATNVDSMTWNSRILRIGE